MNFNLQNSWLFNQFDWCKKEILVIVLLAATIFLAVALGTSNPQDASFFHVSTKTTPVTNACGLFGSYIASLLLFLLASAAWCIIGIMCMMTYFLITNQSMKQEWDRFAAATVGMIVLAALGNLYGFEFYKNTYAGGMIGKVITRLLVISFDRIGTFIFLQMLFIVCVIVLSRLSFIGLIQSTLYSLRALCSWKTVIRPGLSYIVHSMYDLMNKFTYIFRRVYRYCNSLPEPSHANAYDYTTDEYAGSRAIQTPQLTEYYASSEILPNDSSIYENYNEQESEFVEEMTSNSLSQFMTQIAQKVASVVESEPMVHIDIEDFQEEPTVLPKKIVKKAYHLPDSAIFIGVQDEQNDSHLMKELEQRAGILQEKLERFGVFGKVIAIKRGPVVTLFEYQPKIDTKISKIIALEDDLALALQALSIRIIAPIPGRSVIGFEVSNRTRRDVLFASVIQSSQYKDFTGALPLVIGHDTIGNNVVVDLARMPHLLIAGSTGSGKSVALNAMLVSLLCKRSPDELKLILIDPKRLEFAPYADVAHLLFPIVTDPKYAAPVLRWVVQQMEERYEKMAATGARNLFDYNKIVTKSAHEPLPFIVVVVDELADLMMTAGRDIEEMVTRITQMARAAGIHMILATQRPSVDVITGLIKVNFPSRISFRVTSKIDSRTILDCSGADKLLGRGDMLFLDSSDSLLKRVHGAYVSDREIEQVVSHVKSQRQVEYLDITQECLRDKTNGFDDNDPLLDDIVSYLDEIDEVSISLLQRRFRIGYNRSARIIDMLESQGRITPSQGSKTRKVLR